LPTLAQYAYGSQIVPAGLADDDEVRAGHKRVPRLMRLSLSRRSPEPIWEMLHELRSGPVMRAYALGTIWRN
jgi:hypothetical protein